MGKRGGKHSLAFVVRWLASLETLFAYVLSRETDTTRFSRTFFRVKLAQL